MEKAGGIVAVMVLHPQEEVFEIEDFHVKEVQKNKEALALLKGKVDDVPGKC
ncbi:MAG: hypothetical protein QXK26_04385 [Candidatus Bathyarchaeia archaeon]